MEVREMPNWVKVIVHALDEDVDFEKYTNDEGHFTFEKIVPMPKDIYRGDLGEEERAKYGANNWYDWSCKHWGTKWDACETHTQDRTVEFETAWSCPVPVLRELAKQVGGILVFFADEDIGSNCGGFFVKKDGSIVEIEDRYIVANVIFNGLDLRDPSDAIWDFDWILGDDDDE